MEDYNDDFYIKNESGSYTSARHIVPILYDMFKPTSVVDVGCGLGLWLSVFEKIGVSKILGIDSEYVSKKLLKIPIKQFITCNLNEPFEIKEKFDLAICLEVAEHLFPESADIFLNSLTKLSNTIVFSAAVPEQGGVNHLNEQWQSYWIEKFLQRDYICLDIIRPNIWNTDEISFWYKQNTFLFVHNSIYNSVRNILNIENDSKLYDVIHPNLWSIKKQFFENNISNLKSYIFFLENENKGVLHAIKQKIVSMIKTIKKILI